MDSEKRKEDFRNEVTVADDTGLIASQEFVAEVETRPALPRENLHAALAAEHDAHAAIDALHNEMESASPNRRSIESHVGTLRSLPELEATLTNWWDDPNTQRFLANLGQIGL